MSGIASRQDGAAFESTLRRLHAVERKLTDQVRLEWQQTGPGQNTTLLPVRWGF